MRRSTVSDQRPLSAHRAMLERTNMGYYVSGCGCGASLGVYSDRAIAMLAHVFHATGPEVPDDE